MTDWPAGMDIREAALAFAEQSCIHWGVGRRRCGCKQRAVRRFFMVVIALCDSGWTVTAP